MFSIVYVMHADWSIFTMHPRFHVESLYKYRPGNRVEFIYSLLLLLKDRDILKQMMEQNGEETQEVQQQFHVQDEQIVTK